MKRLLISTTLVAGLMATTSAAGGLSPPVWMEPSVTPPAVAVPNWNGPYAGLSYGRTTVTDSYEYEQWRHECRHGTKGNEHSRSKCVIGEDNFNDDEVQAIVGDPRNQNPNVVSYYGNQEKLNWGDYYAIWVPEGQSYEWTTSTDTSDFRSINGKNGAYSVASEMIEVMTEETSESAGAFAGYRQEVGAFVLGGEAGFNGDLKSIEGQVGLNAGQLLPYAFAGVGQFDGEDTDTYGVGADMMLSSISDGMFVGAKYTQGDFGEQATVRVGWNF